MTDLIFMVCLFVFLALLLVGVGAVIMAGIDASQAEEEMQRKLERGRE